MKIGPVDIRNHSFSRTKMRGVDEDEVRAYLDLVADRLEESVLEADDLRARIDRLEKDLDEYRQMDKSLRDALLSAERLADGRLDQADREARIILKNAEVESEKAIAAARMEAGRIRGTLDDLRRQRLTYVERFRALLRSQMKILEASVESFDPELNEVERALDDIETATAKEAPVGAPADPAPTAPPAAPEPPAATAAESAGDDGADEPAPEPEAPGWRPVERAEAPPPPPPAERPTDASRYLGEEGLFSSVQGDEESHPEGR